MTRAGYARLTAFAVLGVAATAVITVPVRLVWNASASVPIGLYGIERVDQLRVGDLVLVRPPEPLARFIAARRYVGPRTPLLKHVVALPGQQVCRSGAQVTVDGRHLGDALQHDREGRPLPVWHGCRVVAENHIFLMNPAIRDSLDGRYFGPLLAVTVIGRASPIFTDPDHDGRFTWRDHVRQPLFQPQPKESSHAADR
jgi:conjugative transfer signal peptidase TraF